MAWFKRQDNEIENSSPEKRVRTEGLWVKCEGCDQYIVKADLDNNQQVCPKCGRHHKIDARARVAALLEPGYELVDLELKSTDPLNFYDVKSYKSRLAKAQEATGLNDAIVNAIGRLGSHDVVLSVMEYAFIGGSMGAVVGETIARAVDRSLESRRPLIIVFAGPRVIEQTIRQKLPEGFQRSEFLLEHGMLDAVVPRQELKAYIDRALDFFVG